MKRILTNSTIIFRKLLRVLFYRSKSFAEIVTYKFFSLWRIAPKRVCFHGHIRPPESLLAIFEYLVSVTESEDFEIFWVLPDSDQIAFAKNRFSGKYIFVSYDTWRAKYALAASKFIFYTHYIPTFVKPRDSQKIINLWHGMSIKKVGYLDPLDRPNVKSATHSVATSAYFQKIMADSFRVPLPNALLVGIPRNDWLLSPDREAIERLGCPGSRITIWLPTFRHAAYGMRRVDAQEPILSVTLLQDIDRRLQDSGVTLIVKFHRNDALNDTEWPNFAHIVVLTEKLFLDRQLNLYRLIAATDAVITDFSSVAVDAVGYGKPVAIYAPDIDSYGRGFNEGVIPRMLAVTTPIADIEQLVQFVAGKVPPVICAPRDVDEVHSVSTGNVAAKLLAALDFFDQ